MHKETVDIEKPLLMFTVIVYSLQVTCLHYIHCCCYSTQEQTHGLHNNGGKQNVCTQMLYSFMMVVLSPCLQCSQCFILSLSIIGMEGGSWNCVCDLIIHVTTGDGGVTVLYWTIGHVGSQVKVLS